MKNKKYEVWCITKDKRKTFDTLQAAAKSMGVSYNKLQYALKKQLRFDYRNPSNDLYFQCMPVYDYVVTATPIFGGDMPTQHYASVTACCKDLGIGKSVYYDRLKLQPLNEPCEKVVLDEFKREWILTFHKDNSKVPLKKKGE